MVLLGTPNQGTVTAVHKFLNGYRVGVGALPTEGVATMPVHLPAVPAPAGGLGGQHATASGSTFDVFDVEFWRRYEWSIFDHRIQRRMDRHRDVWPQQDVFERWFEKRLERGRRFAWSLMVPSGPVPLVKPLLLGGDCVPTPRRLVFENIGGESIARLRPEQILLPTPGIDYEELMFAPGDGSVTRSSLFAPGHVPRSAEQEQEGLEPRRELFVCAHHDALTSKCDCSMR